MFEIDDLPHDIKEINKLLVDRYGRFETLLIAKYRLVWSTNEFEKRWTKYTREGFELLQREVKVLPKYRQTDPDRWVLERCLGVPEFMETDLVEKYSYEPIWVFKTESGDYITPVYRACEFIIETVHKQAADAIKVKYQDPTNVDLKVSAEAEYERISKLKEELFGNETDLSDALSHREGIVVP